MAEAAHDSHPPHATGPTRATLLLHEPLVLKNRSTYTPLGGFMG